MRYHLTTAINRMTIIKETKEVLAKIWRILEYLNTIGGKVNWYSHYEKHHGVSAKNLK